MKTKLLALALLILAFSVVGSMRISSSSQEQKLTALDRSEDRGTIAWHMRLAKAKGEKQVTIPSIIGIPAEIAGLDDALTRFRVVIAQPLEMYTHVSGQWSLLTWYRFKVLEDLSSATLRKCSSCGGTNSEIPDALLPVNANEILVPEPGGVVTVEGLTLVQKPSMPLDTAIGSAIADLSDRVDSVSSGTSTPRSYKRVLASRRFLLFLSPAASEMVGRLSLGSRGVFAINTDGSLDTIDGRPSITRAQLQQFHIGSIDELRGYVRRLRESQ